MTKFRNWIDTHPAAVKNFIWGYTVFATCCTFPLWSEPFPLDLMKAYLLVAQYAIIAKALAGSYGVSKEKELYLKITLFTAVGMLCRYLLEFGEVSNTYNFTVINMVLYILIIPIATVITYHLVVKKI